jgi:hypothetical protein
MWQTQGHFWLLLFARKNAIGSSFAAARRFAILRSFSPKYLGATSSSGRVGLSNSTINNNIVLMVQVPFEWLLGIKIR